MKTKSLMALVAFIFAVGSAVATDLLTDPTGYSRKTDVPIQINNCQSRTTCPGGSDPCTALVDHDGNPSTGMVSVNLYNGVTTPQLICGAQLFQP